MKKRIWLCLTALSFLLTACNSAMSPTEQPAITASEPATPTGYPSDELQRASVYYNGTLYLYSAEGIALPLEDGFKKVGSVSAVDNLEYPSEEFHGSRLETGQEVYANQDMPEKIYVKYDSGYGLFTGEVVKSKIADGNNSAYDRMISNDKVFDVESAVSAAILNANKDGYASGECLGEGHTILGTEESGDQVKAYVLAMFGWYQFQDGNLVKNSGSGVIPTVITLKYEEDGSYSLQDYKTAQDGSLYIPSIEEMFPEEYWEICIVYSEDRVKELTDQERTYAAAYLEKLGRKAEIGDYGDFEHTLLTESGVSVEVSNQLLENKNATSYYPSWIGNLEQVENGIRYLYEKSYDPQKKEIIYTKTDLTTNTIVEESIYNSENAVLISHRNLADKSAVQSEAALNSLTGVAMEAVEGSAEAGSVKLRLENETDRDIIFDDSYEIQRFDGGYWCSVPYIIDNWVFNAIAYPLKKGQPSEITVDWTAFHGELEPGIYRILKDVSDFRGTGDYTMYFLAAEFDLADHIE